ncbi:MAG: amidase family protein [Cellvibrionaceae bacterium]
MLSNFNKDLSALALVERYKTGQADPVSVVEGCLKKASSSQAKGVFITLTPERARQEALASRDRYRRGAPLSPLDGVPIAWKDLFDIEHYSTTAGSSIYRSAAPAAKDAEIVANSTLHGLITIGKTNLSEFAYSGLGLNPHYGTPINPCYQPARIPGGSSSGSALTVAMGIVPCAIGTDTSGSVRIPASFNGIIGFKASVQRFLKQGVYPLSKTLDSIGIFAHKMEDCIQLDAVLRNNTEINTTAVDIKNCTFIVPENIVFAGVEPSVLKNFDNTINALEKNGATIDYKTIPALTEVQQAFAKYGTIVAAEAYQQYASILNSPKALELDPNIRHRLSLAAHHSSEDYYCLQQLRPALIQAISTFLNGDILTYPTLPCTAPLLKPLLENNKIFAETNAQLLRNTMLTNYLDMPGIALPNGFDEQGLASSVMLSVPSGRDDFLLSLSVEIESFIFKVMSGSNIT